jgi:hypothetical protein
VEGSVRGRAVAVQVSRHLGAHADCGKTEFARSLFRNAFLHRDSISWTGYDEDVHDAVIFDDIKCVYKIVSDNRALFQASGTAMQQTSATNVHALSVDVTAKPIVITSNYEPRGECGYGEMLSSCRCLSRSTPLMA